VISADAAAFPNNVVSLVSSRIQLVDSDLQVFLRPLRRTDPDQAVGIFGSLWDAPQDSLEIGHFPFGEPTLQRYQLGIQALVKDGEEERGLAAHSVLSRAVRVVLYRDQAFRVALQALYVQDMYCIERTRRWWLGSQRYMNNDVEGKFIYLSTLEYWVETEMA
jgi:hypothetical protein